MQSIFTNPIVIIAIPLCSVMAIMYFIMIMKPSKKVLLLRPRDQRGKSLSVDQETDLGLFCKAVKGVTHRFIKVGPAWVFHEGGRMITNFFGMEGTAYTAVAKGDEMVNISVKEYLEFLWTPKWYAGIPQVQRNKVETDVIGITIVVEKINEEERGLETLTSADINDENDNIVLSKIAEPQKSKTSDTVMKTIVNFLLGAAVMYFTIKQGYL